MSEGTTAPLVNAASGGDEAAWNHLVAVQDGCRWLLARVGLAPKPLQSVLLAWVPWIAFVYMFVWPLAYRLVMQPDLGALFGE